MKIRILGKTSNRMTAAAGHAPGGVHTNVASANGMAEVGKSVALNGL